MFIVYVVFEKVINLSKIIDLGRLYKLFVNDMEFFFYQ